MSEIDTVKDKIDAKVSEPALQAHVVLWIVALAGELAVGRLHLFSSDQWSSLQLFLTPVITTAVFAISAWLLRSVVSPAAAFAHRVEAEVERRMASLEGTAHDPRAVLGTVELTVASSAKKANAKINEMLAGSGGGAHYGGGSVETIKRDTPADYGVTGTSIEALSADPAPRPSPAPQWLDAVENTGAGVVPDLDDVDTNEPQPPPS